MSVHIAVHQLVTNSDDRRVVVAHQLWLYRPRDPGGGHCWAGLASPQTPPVSTEAAPSCPSRAHRHPRTHPQGTHPWPSNTPSRNTTMAIKRGNLTKIAKRVKHPLKQLPLQHYVQLEWSQVVAHPILPRGADMSTSCLSRAPKPNSIRDDPSIS